MAVLVTGAAGFVALNVIEHLLRGGRDVVGLDRIPLPERARRTFASLPGRLTLIGGSILSDADLSRAMTVVPVEAVIHCAVITAGAEREKTAPETIVGVNVQGAVATLMAAARRGVARFVYPSSGSIYGRAAAGIAMLDEDAVNPAPVALYGLTKRAAETILPRIAETQGVRFTAVRLGSVYGPWEYATGVRDTLSPMLQSLQHATARTEAVLGQPWVGDYVYARDVAAGLVRVADAPALSRTVYNLASGRAATVEAWCEALAAAVPGFRWRRARTGEAPTVESHIGFDRGAMDIRRIAAETGYAPAFDFAAAARDWTGWIEAG
ncbi:MAG TPA: NAD(P)-dependent oxidoreductase [Acetobacteraceae bacterium]|nr:NAD(P)-dependent oxidoreductase [Acetobacteraceae bacterium]